MSKLGELLRRIAWAVVFAGIAVAAVLVLSVAWWIAVMFLLGVFLVSRLGRLFGPKPAQPPPRADGPVVIDGEYSVEPDHAPPRSPSKD